MKSIRESIKLFRYNLIQTVIYELLLYVIAAAVLMPVYFLLIRASIYLSGLKYLSRENVSRYIRSPSTWAMMVLLLFLLAFAMLINAAGLDFSMRRASHLQKTAAIRMLGRGFRGALRLFRPKNLPMILFLLVFLPVSGTEILSAGFLNLKVPYYLTDFFRRNPNVRLGLGIGMGSLTLAAFAKPVLLSVFLQEKKSFPAAWREDTILRKRGKKKGKRALPLKGLLWTCLILGAAVVVRYYLTGPLLRILLDRDSSARMVSNLYAGVITALSAVFALAAMPLMSAYYSSMYQSLLDRKTGIPDIREYQYDTRKAAMRERAAVLLIAGIAAVADMAIFLLARYDVIRTDTGTLHLVKIMAHRGDSANAPENTMAAFEKAIENGADYIELDVHITKDHVVVVSHDESLRRICGVNRNIRDLTYSELQKYSAGKWFSKDGTYDEEKFPTLAEVIQTVGKRARLNIELKPTGRGNTPLEEEVTKLIEENDYYDQCVVQSMRYRSVQEVKKLDSRITTIYVMSVAMGDFYQLEDVDGFNIKSGYITAENVRETHRAGKQIYAWDVENEETLRAMMIDGVDAVITNDPAKMQAQMYQNYYSDMPAVDLNTYIKNIL